MRIKMMLMLPCLLGVVAAQTGPNPSSSGSLFDSQIPDATILIHKHPMGADMVEITMTKRGYPPDLLHKQIIALGKYLQSEPRGVDIHDYILDPSNPDSHFTQASFAVDGVIDRKLGGYRLNPFAKALAGAPKPWLVHSLQFQLQGEVPTSHTLKLRRTDSVLLEARYEDTKDPNRAGVEYRVELLTQDPAKLDIPEPGDQPVKRSSSKAPVSTIDWSVIVIFSVAAIALGALVYSLLLRSRPKPRIL